MHRNKGEIQGIDNLTMQKENENKEREVENINWQINTSW